MSKLCPCTMGNSVAGALFNLRNARKLNKEEPDQTGVGTVISRRVDTVYSLTRSDSSWAYFVKFRPENGEEVELKVTQAQYKELKEGLSVKLCWQGDTVTAFEAE